MDCIDEMLMNTGSVKLEDLRAARDAKDLKEEESNRTDRSNRGEAEMANPASNSESWLTEMLEDLAKCQEQGINKNHDHYMN